MRGRRKQRYVATTIINSFHHIDYSIINKKKRERKKDAPPSMQAASRINGFCPKKKRTKKTGVTINGYSTFLILFITRNPLAYGTPYK
jgi:hypothetical protein